MNKTKSITVTAVFLALILISQFALSSIPNIEMVTLLCTLFFYAFGIKLGLILAVAFSLVRCVIFGYFPSVLVLYLVYYVLFAIVVGLIGKKFNHKYSVKSHVITVIAVCLLTCLFTLLDDVITPLFYGLYGEEMKAYFVSSLPFMLVQVLCSLISITFVFPWLQKLLEKYFSL